jgi:hypothetical protein
MLLSNIADFSVKPFLNILEDSLYWISFSKEGVDEFTKYSPVNGQIVSETDPNKTIFHYYLIFNVSKYD